MFYKDQVNKTMAYNYDIRELIDYYTQLMCVIKERLNEFNYSIFKINDYENVLLIEDSLVLYIGAKEKNFLLDDKTTKNGNIVDRYVIVIQELTYNEIFNKRAFSKFLKGIHILDGVYKSCEHKNNIYYRPFKISQPYEPITKGYHQKAFDDSNFDYVCEAVPELRLKERYTNWQGRLVYIIVYEFHYNGQIGYASARTYSSNPMLEAQRIINQYEARAGYLGMHFPQLNTEASWTKLMRTFVDDQKEQKWVDVKTLGNKRSLLAGKVTYFVVPKYEKNDSLDNEYIKFEYKPNKFELEDYSEFDHIERTLYDISEYKWKSEELMLECIKKVFKNKTVIHQFRPFFLHSKNGQLSYDVFVCGKNIAFEYQGEQHFKPIEYFGGEDNFEKQKERDRIKWELSKENNVSLIYVNYWENISTDLIKEKLKENGISF